MLRKIERFILRLCTALLFQGMCVYSNHWYLWIPFGLAGFASIDLIVWRAISLTRREFAQGSSGNEEA
jgi:hypothetical protein